MKKIVLSLVASALLSACSNSVEKMQTANDTYQNSDREIPSFSPLASGGVTLPQADPTYELPQLNAKKERVDIRPPSTPLAIIKNSLTQFDGERALVGDDQRGVGEHALIVYTDAQAELYNLKQIERLLKEEGTNSTLNGAVLISDWAPTGRADDKANTEIRYKIEQVTAQDASALAVSVEQMRRDGVIYTPNQADKQRYASDRLNRFVAALTNAYNKQQQDLNNASAGPFQSGLITDTNGRMALGMDASFGQAWQRLGSTLPKLGFKATSESAGRGYRELKYKPLDKQEWLRLGVNPPNLEKGVYQMQISAVGKQSAVVITDEDGKALPNEAAQSLYSALSVLLAQ